MQICRYTHRHNAYKHTCIHTKYTVTLIHTSHIRNICQLQTHRILKHVGYSVERHVYRGIAQRLDYAVIIPWQSAHAPDDRMFGNVCMHVHLHACTK